MTENERNEENGTNGDCESAFAREWRAAAVSAFCALPGALAGALARLCIPDGGPVAWWMIGGGLLAALFGVLLESDHLPG